MSIFPDEFDPTYEDYVTKFLEYDEKAEGILWQRGDLLVEFTCQPTLERAVGTGVRSLRALASDVAKHHKTLERWRHTAATFSNPDDRVALLSFSHHTVAAYSKKPHYWLQKAADKEWSKTQLLNAIKAAEHPEEAWVSKTLRGRGNLYGAILDDRDAVSLTGMDFILTIFAREGDPFRFGCGSGEKAIPVEVEARIRVRKVKPP